MTTLMNHQRYQCVLDWGRSTHNKLEMIHSQQTDSFMTCFYSDFIFIRKSHFRPTAVGKRYETASKNMRVEI